MNESELTNIRPEPFVERREKPWGYELIWTPPGLARVGKIIHVNAGCKLSLQYHDQKEETVMLYAGKAVLWWQDGEGTVHKISMEPKKGYTIFPGTIHRYEALEDTDLIEVSDPERGTTYRLQDDYRRPDEKR
jgi:mannose-6-phosphate isomerase